MSRMNDLNLLIRRQLLSVVFLCFRVSINGRWEKAIEELGERQLSDDDLVVVNSFYDENWDDNNINELKIKYCELSEKLNDEIRK